MPIPVDYTIPATDNIRIPRRTMYAVYWPAPTTDGDGRRVYEAPVEIRCFWIDKQEITVGPAGDQEISNATVYVDRDLAKQGVLWKGKYSELQDAENPFENDENGGAWEVKFAGKVPNTKGTKFSRSVKL